MKKLVNNKIFNMKKNRRALDKAIKKEPDTLKARFLKIISDYVGQKIQLLEKEENET